ncbi:MAG: DUF192 domain-containing protein [Dehalococcoidia bacterium]
MPARQMFFLGVALAVLALSLAGCRSGGSDKTFEVRLSQGAAQATVTVEVAATTRERQQGLMFRQELDEDKGMLFLFPRDVLIGFWMKNTYVPLDIAYISADGEVLEIRAAKPLDETTLSPAKEYRYTLEVNQGWFERHGLDVGAKVDLPKGLPAATE